MSCVHRTLVRSVLYIDSDIPEYQKVGMGGRRDKTDVEVRKWTPSGTGWFVDGRIHPAPCCSPPPPADPHTSSAPKHNTNTPGIDSSLDLGSTGSDWTWPLGPGQGHPPSLPPPTHETMCFSYTAIHAAAGVTRARIASSSSFLYGVYRGRCFDPGT